MEHPAVTDSLKRLAELERRSPPGYPLGYSLHLHSWLCKGCGATGKSSLLWTVVRVGGAGKAYHITSDKEKLYALPVDTVRRSDVTMRCEACITLPREAVPAFPAYKKKISLNGAEKIEIDLDELFEGEIDLAGLGLL